MADRMLDPLLDRLLPDGAAGCEVFADPPEAEPWPDEVAAVAGAVQSRRREFAAGRWCAREAMSRLGLPPVAVPAGERGMPLWPDGVVGSITHCAGYRAAVVAPGALLAGIGVDAEPHAPLPGNVLDVVALPEELAALPALAAAAHRAAAHRTAAGMAAGHRGEQVDVVALHADLLLFSAKEAVYKAWFPIGRRVLAHPHVRVEADPVGGFVAGLTSSAPVSPGVPTRFAGRWLVDRGLLVTLAVALPG